MTVIRWRPATNPRNTLRDFDRQFARLAGNNKNNNGLQKNAGWNPAMDISEAKDRYLLSVELPGLTNEDVRVTMKDHVLTVEGEKKVPMENDTDNPIYSERDYGVFKRSVHIDEDVATGDIDASFESGVLTISLPKIKERIQKDIPVNFRN